MTDPIWRELDAWVKEYTGPISSSAENDLCDIVGRLVAAEREACALHLDHLVAGADLAKRNFTAIGEPDHAERHEHYRTAYVTAAAAIRARGDTPA